MPGSARAWRGLRHLLVVLYLVVAPALDAPDGDVAEVEVGAAETVARHGAGWCCRVVLKIA